MRFIPLHLFVTTLNTVDGILWGDIRQRRRSLRYDSPNVWQRRRTRRQLAELDAHQLQDIGLLPSQVYRETHRPFWR
ncbi:DUF1127 domain-containing protein [Salinicola sp. DM10]|uniref:DUF1127 domain-containing protein n=1 Tax=Salinicola sp. DM10 TaxID=2815721 RepID=UPI001E476B6D|nr:DUF1127 domain-containing protein [Salinicola sp. DM10]MCE3027910.1 DUF1127 domain-containing protein [Salinicola sp. DM10]